MKPHFECEFESDALSAALQSRWPGHVDASLREHVAGCTICAEVIAVATAVDDAREELRDMALIPDSGRVWWLAQLRARREAAEAAGSPITAIQLITVACAVGLLGACFGRIASSFDPKTLLPSALSLLVEHTALVLGVAVILFLVPAVVLVTVRRD